MHNDNLIQRLQRDSFHRTRIKEDINFEISETRKCYKANNLLQLDQFVHPVFEAMTAVIHDKLIAILNKILP